MASPSASSASRPLGPRLALVAGVVVLGVLVGLLLEGLYRTRPVDEAKAAAAPQAAGPAAAPAPRPPAAGPALTGAAAVTPEKQIPPWEATPANTPPPPPGHIPAWVVKPPRPEPSAPPAPPVEPPDPATHRPPMHNPGGVNGDRPPRPVPGLAPP
ncbi:MAG TPA: hypothetical protein VGQ83_09800 [Polyangia bacterium]|jgi:hypothetical protein